MFNSKPTIETTTMHYINMEMLKWNSHIHNSYPLLYRQSRQQEVWMILRVPEAIHITCNIGTCDLPDLYTLGHTYQANFLCRCYNYYITAPDKHIIVLNGILKLLIKCICNSMNNWIPFHPSLHSCISTIIISSIHLAVMWVKV